MSNPEKNLFPALPTNARPIPPRIEPDAADNCGACFFWLAAQAQQHAGQSFAPCRRNPPAVILVPTQTGPDIANPRAPARVVPAPQAVRPFMASVDWCGEFRVAR